MCAPHLVQTSFVSFHLAEMTEEVFVATPTLAQPQKEEVAFVCVCSYMKASHLLRQGCKLAPHLLPQLDQITFTLHPLSSPCVVPGSLYLSSIHPLLTHYLTLSWD